MRRRIALLVVLICCLFISIAAISFLLEKTNAHSSILIAGENFLNESQGVVGGSGTEVDPYVIEGWSFSPSDVPAIRIENTRSHIVLRNLTINGLESFSSGISIRDSSNITIKDCTIDCVYGIGLCNATNISVERNVVSASWKLIIITDSSNISVVENHLIGKGPLLQFGIPISFCNSCDVVAESNIAIASSIVFTDTDADQFRSISIDDSNTIGGLPYLLLIDESNIEFDEREFCQIFLVGCSHVGLSDMVFDDEWNAISLLECRDIYLFNLTMNDSSISIMLSEDMTLVGNDFCQSMVSIRECSDVIVTSNDFYNESSLSFEIYENSTNHTVCSNNFLDDERSPITISWAASVDIEEHITFSLEYPLGGNYWGTYENAVDIYSGPDQNILGADGIADAPFEFLENYPDPSILTDRYPVMEPFSR